jgi:hypothetical protein
MTLAEACQDLDIKLMGGCAFNSQHNFMYKLLKSELGQCQHERILCLHKSMPELHSVAFGSNSLVNLEANLNTLA